MPHQLFVSADHDTLAAGLGGDDIQRLARRDTQATTLADSEMMRSGMLAQNVTRCIDDLTLRFRWVDAALPKIGVDKRRVIAVWHKADFLAIVLVGNRET